MSETMVHREGGGAAPVAAVAEAAEAEFVELLNRGNDHLARGDVQAARLELERAVAMRPGDAKAQGLLGLCCFKLGLLDRASEIYVALTKENPLDATLHVNLGLVQLKGGHADAAVRSLEAAVGLAPDHRKAHNYLGLAYAQIGALAKARDAFLHAGSAAKAAEMERALAQASGGGAAAPAEAAPAPEAPSSPIPAVSEFTRSARLFWPRGAPFAVDPDGVAVDFSAGIFTRTDGLIVARGDTTWTPVRKRFGGKVTDRSFGSGALQMWHAAGGGQLLISSHDGEADRVFSAIRLEEDAYVVEDRLFAFEEALDVENGRVPGQATDLALVRLRGTGHLLLVTRRPVRSEPIFGNESLRLPMAGLVGWTGPLTPRLLPMGQGPGGVWVELTGEGDVLLLA